MLLVSAVFDESSKYFSTEPGRNLAYLNMVQAFMNDKLKAQGHLFLNEVFDHLAIPRTREGQVKGWIFFEKFKPESFVNLGINVVPVDPADPIHLRLNPEADILRVLDGKTS